MKVNPFSPNAPVTHGMFIGRVPEIKVVQQSLLQTRAGQPAPFMVTGERGIGKSSLLNLTKAIATGGVPIDGALMNFLCVMVDVQTNTTQVGLIRRIKAGLERELGREEPIRSLLNDIWAFLQRIRIMDSGIQGKNTFAVDGESLPDEFAYSLAETADRFTQATGADGFGPSGDGILVLIDEANNASPELDLGTFIKLTNERLQRCGCNHVSFGLAGLPLLRSCLYDSHPSSLRLFDEVVLDRLSNRDVEAVVDLNIDAANEMNDEKTSIDEEGKSTLVSLSEGYPHFIQQFGYSAFEIDDDNIISMDDVIEGATHQRGAIELIGNRYYRNDFYDKIQNDAYRQVLRIMAEKLDDWISKQEIRDQFRGGENTLSNAIYTLRNKNIIQTKEGEKGVYRLRQRAFAWWIRMRTQLEGPQE